MNYAKLSEESLDKIMEKIRSETGIIKKVDNSKSEEIQFYNYNNEDYEIIDKYLNESVIGKQIGLNKAPMTAKRGIALRVSRIIEKYYLRVSQLITRDIRDFNGIIMSLIHAIKRKLIIIDDNTKHLNNKYNELNDKIDILELKIIENIGENKKRNDNIENELKDELKRKIQETYNKIDSQQTENKNRIEFIENSVKDELSCFSEIINNNIKNITDKIENKNREEILAYEKNMSDKISLVVEKYNKTQLLIREFNEELIKLKSIVTWVNKEEFTESILTKIGSDTLINPVFYHEFEEKFRGTREDIKERLMVYIPILDKLFGEWKDKRFIDIGCGRGEWLDILKEKGVSDYIGVDLNDVQLNVCNEYGHSTVNCDCLAYIQKLTNDSVDMISGFQIIEHLTIENLFALFNQCNRVLKKGGVMLFETPNPNNLITGATYFYADPTHKQPLYKDSVKFFVEHSGFSKVDILEVNDARFSKKLITPTTFDGNQEIWDENINILNTLFYGPQDYAVMGVK